MPQPININTVPLSYFLHLHEVDAAQNAQNVHSPGGVEGQNADNNGVVANPLARQSGPAAKMVQQLDVLLVKAAKASTQSLDAKKINSSLNKLVTDGVIDKGDLKSLAKVADTAAKAMKALDKFTGAQLAAAVKQGTSGLNTFLQIDENTKAGKAIKAAVDAQNALSDKLAQLDHKLNAYERHDDEIRAIKKSKYNGVDSALHDEVVEFRCLCDRRATEINAIAFQMHDFAVQQATQGNNEDPNIAAILKAKVADLLPRQALAMHGTADALATVSREITLRLRPLAERIDAFKNNPSATISGEDFLSLRSDVTTMKAALADIRQNGIKVGDGRMMVAKDIINALTKEVAHAEKLLNTAHKSVRERVLNNFITTALNVFSVEEAIEGQLVLFDDKYTTLFNARDNFIKSMVNVRDELIKPKMDVDAINKALKMTQTAAQEYVDSTYGIPLPPGQDGGYAAQVIRAGQAAHTVAVRLAELVGNSLNSNSIFTSSEAMSIFKGELSVSSLVESRVRSLQDGDVDPANEDSNIVSSKRLGAGNAGTVYLLQRRDGSEVVFKGEMESRAGLNGLSAGGGAAYQRAQKTVNLNIASKNCASSLGCGNLIVNYKAGVHKGTFGFFMDKAKGRTGRDFAEGGGAKTDSAGLAGSEISSLPSSERRRVKGEIMRQLNRLQWVDIITGQLDRHDDNYFIHVDRHSHEVTVTGIDNDACYSAYRVGISTMAFDKDRSAKFIASLTDVLKSSGVKDAANEAKRILRDDPSITRQGDEITVNAAKVTNNAILAAIKYITGAQSLAIPDKIDRDLYNHLMELKNNPEKRNAYLNSIKPRIGDKNLAAAESRLKDAIAHAERLEKEGKVVDENAWPDETNTKISSKSIKFELQNGKQKSLPFRSSSSINYMTCSSYFARDKIDSLF